MSNDAFDNPISRRVWQTKYRYPQSDRRVGDSWRRVARALASAEPTNREAWEARFYALLSNFKFLPAGRILAGAGTGRRVTLFNCFVMGLIEDSMDGIFDALKESALTMQQGGGIGIDFSTLRPHGVGAQTVGGIASGPVSFMRIWDSMCATVLSTGARRGAMMATLRCDHPDIEQFISAKGDARELRHFNLSVQVTEAFMRALGEDGQWPLVFPAARLGAGYETRPLIERAWPGFSEPTACRVLRVVRARTLWDRLMRATYDYAEPGVVFIDRVNELNNLRYRERISATNPCGEVPLPPYGACNLGSINLTRFVRDPFTEAAKLDLSAIAEAVPTAVRMLDNVISVSRFPFPAQEQQARGTRRIGLGITGLADAFIMLGIGYGDERSYELAGRIMGAICHSAYRYSTALAREKGSFPWFEREKYLAAPFIRSLPEEIQHGIAEAGIRNSHLVAIAPTGTISLLANNVSSALEPVFAFQAKRKVHLGSDACEIFEVTDFALRLWRALKNAEALPPQFIEAQDLPPSAHLKMQAALQPYVDNSISKTINVPEAFGFEDFRALYEQAYDLGLKGCTTFRPNPTTGSVLEADTDRLPHCCAADREAD